MRKVKFSRGEQQRSDEFLQSGEWRRLRMRVLLTRGARCECCGATPNHGVRINVDHVKPRRLHPELSLVESNLQVLCEDCNHGKGNWDQTDWRVPKPRPVPARHIETVSSEPLFLVTRAWLKLHSTTGESGWTMPQLAALGVSWPPPRKWLQRMHGKYITQQQRRDFESGKALPRLMRPADADTMTVEDACRIWERMAKS